MTYYCPCGAEELVVDENDTASCRCGITWEGCARRNLPTRRLSWHEYQAGIKAAMRRAGLAHLDHHGKRVV